MSSEEEVNRIHTPQRSVPLPVPLVGGDILLTLGTGLLEGKCDGLGKFWSVPTPKGELGPRKIRRSIQGRVPMQKKNTEETLRI